MRVRGCEWGVGGVGGVEGVGCGGVGCKMQGA